jgi:hypothetical protein
MPVKLSVERTNKRQRRHIRDLPQSSEFIFTSDNDDQHESSVREFLTTDTDHSISYVILGGQ